MSGSGARFLGGALAVYALFAAWPASVQAGKISISMMPEVSAPILVADDTTVYSVTMAASAEWGYNDIASTRVLFNYSESDSISSRGRGYLAWGLTDASITNYGGTWSLADASGGGRWGYSTSEWGGVTYITPLSCVTSTSGQASGGTGTRTVTWTFRAKPAWAADPIINDADAWAQSVTNSNESMTCSVGWLDNPVAFDVVAAPCTEQQTTPRAPIVSNPTPTTVDVSIHPDDSDTDRYAIYISPPIDSQISRSNYNYVMGNGTVAARPLVWQTKATWGTIQVSGLTSNTTYSIKIRAFNNIEGVCPSEWSPEAVITTASHDRAIDCAAEGIEIHKGVHGMDAQPKDLATKIIEDTLAASWNTSMRACGDGYNWKRRNTSTPWAGTNDTSVLEYLRYARDRNSYLQIVVNTRGIGTGNGPTFVYTDQTPETVAELAADLVYYCNFLVQNKRQGDPLTTREQAIIDSLEWGDDDKLLAPGEPPVPRVDYWEIGNEPEGPYPPPALSASDYGVRYSTITSAMVAEDPTIQVGPSYINSGSNAYIDAVLSNPDNRVDFMVHHSYGRLYHVVRSNSGGYLNEQDLRDAIRREKREQNTRIDIAIDRIVYNGRPADLPQINSEMNPSEWRGVYYYNLSQTVIHGLGIAETVFSYVERNILASQYWEMPNKSIDPNVDVPGFQVFQALQAYLKGALLDSLIDGNFRLYTTRDADTDQIILWAINFSDAAATPLRIRLENLPSRAVAAVTQRKLAAYEGETTLSMLNTTSVPIGWAETDLTGLVDLSDFTMTFDQATLTMIIVDFVEPEYFTLTVTSEGASEVEVTSTTGHGGTTDYIIQSVRQDGRVNLEAPPYLGSGLQRKGFTGWTGSITSGDHSVTFFMDGNKTVTANYVDNPAVIYVDDSATGANDGTSWADAFTELQDALAAVVSDDEQVWVAAGTYTPTSGSDRSVSYVLPEDVAIYGGFAGNEDPATFDLADRDFQANETILSGDIGVPGNNSDNSYHVVTGTDGATLDGFTITGGYANGSTAPEQSGGGMYNDATSPTVSNCTFTANEASVGGGGMYNNAAGPTVTHCTFASNSAATNGGGMYNNVASPTVTSCTFFGNAALSGGGMANASSGPAVTNCTFSNNSASRDGGAYFNWRSNPTITNCTLTANSATNNGGGMFNFASSPVIANCILWDNVGGQITSGTPTVTYSCVQGGYTGEGNIDADPFLSPLADNGGPTWTHALASNSPAYAIAESAGGGNWNGAPDTDQRGQPRATTGYRAMGAFEDEYIAPPPVVTSAASVKNHGPAGDLGIAIVLSGGSVECRTDGPTKLVVTFDQDIYGSGGLPVDDVTLSAGTVEAVTIDGNAVTVDLSGVPDATVLTVAFPGIENVTAQPCADTLCVRVLAGDVNGDGEVGIFDLVAMRDNTGQPVTEADCPCDVNSDGAINIFDLVNVRDQTGATVGSCP